MIGPNGGRAVYVGRIVAIGRTTAGSNLGAYRVSSRSFPNRKAVEIDGRCAVVPREGHEDDIAKNPYIAYNCLRRAGSWAIVSNGSHTDPISEKVEAGMPIRDALALSLLALDYEKDDYNTPRIAGAVPLEGDSGWLATVRRDALVLVELPLEAGRASYVATYELDDPRAGQSSVIDAVDAEGVARAVVDGGEFAKLTNPVTSAAVVARGSRFELATSVV